MATKTKLKEEPAKARNAIQVICLEGANVDDAIARTVTKPEVNAAQTIQRFTGNRHEVNALARELAAQVAAVHGGDLKRAEGMLITQAHTLDELFNSLARRAHLNMNEYMNAAETYLRLALKAQSQCRVTLETLANIKNPPVIYARQANVTTGAQQINNSISAPSHAREIENLQNKQSEGDNGLLPDTGTPALAGRVNPAMEALGAINRAEVKSG